MTTIQGIGASKATEYYYENDPIFNPDNEKRTSQQNIQWYGKLSHKLGIDNDITAIESYNIFQGKSLDGQEQLIDRSKNITNGNENAVFDIPLTAPKPISALALMDGGDKRVLDAFNDAVKTTVEYFEENCVQTRGMVQQEDGSMKRETYKTGNAIIATAQHSTNRNNDIHLHSHMLVVNQTYDKNTSTYKALNLDFNQIKEVNAVMSTELMKNVRELGYEIEIRENGQWNIKGFDEHIIDAMSTRKQEIMNVLDKLSDNEIGVDTARNIAYETKNAKDVTITKEQIQSRAREQIQSVGATIEELKQNAMSKEKYQNHFSSAKEVLEKAGEHLSDSNARFTQRELLMAASSISNGEYSYKDLKDELDTVKKTGQKEGQELKRLGTDKNTGQEIFTTKEMHQMEKQNLEFVRRNVQVEAIMTKEQAQAGLADFEDKYFKLTQGQYDAAMNILSSTDQIGIVQGYAGSGKSSMFKSVAHSMAFYENNNEVLLTAVANKAVSGGVEASKMDNGESFIGQTLHKTTRGGLEEVMTNNQKSQTKLLIIEEASMASAKDINKILNDVNNLKTDGYNIKIQLVGDKNQLLPIGSGSPFEQFQKELQDRVVMMDESQRQRTITQQEITNPISKKDIQKSFENMDKVGAIKEVVDKDERIKLAVSEIVKKEFVDIQNFKGEIETKSINYKNTVGLAATNAENRAINEGVRTELQNQGLIKDEVKTNVNVSVLKDNIKQSTASNYEKGDKVKTYEKVAGMIKNIEYEVVGINPSKNTVKMKTIEPDNDGKHKYSIVKATKMAGKVTVNKEEERVFGVGDKIMITETDKKAGLTNSDQGLIISMNVKQKVATVDFGEMGIKEINLNQQKNLDLGYSMTVHKSQGISIERVVAFFDSKENSKSNTMNSFYVAMSRQTAQSVAITDSKEDLMKQVSKEASNVSSLDDLKKKSNSKFGALSSFESQKNDKNHSASKVQNKEETKAPTIAR
jgi:conjugative relaxase-like TrwC/TraI family protein